MTKHHYIFTIKRRASGMPGYQVAVERDGVPNWRTMLCTIATGADLEERLPEPVWDAFIKNRALLINRNITELAIPYTPEPPRKQRTLKR